MRTSTRMLTGLILCFGSLGYAGTDRAAPDVSEQPADTVLSFRLQELATGENFMLPEDLEISLWAETPLLFNPTNIDVDERGRVWVTEAVNYRDFNNQDGHLSRGQGDRVVILEDADADGRADTAMTFVQDVDLRAPLGIARIGSRVVVSSSPSLLVYTDTDGDDRPDAKDTLLTGFGGYDHDHGLHSVTVGPDGLWYFNAGNAGPHVVTDRNGWTLRSGSVYKGGTPYNTDNDPGLVSDDGRVWVGGVALRVRPNGTGLEVLAHNFRNAYELAVDSYGNLWQNDNDDEVMACRTTWVMEGGNHGYFSADGSRTWQADRRPGQETFAAHWHQEDPGVIPAGDNTGAGAPSGIVMYESDKLGEKYRGMLLSADAGRNVIYAYWPRPDGAGFALDRIDLITPVTGSTESYVWNDVPRDTAKWFRPSDVAVGADGAIYIADWYDPVVGGHQMHDRRGYGRIYRVAPRGRNLETPAIDLGTTEGAVDALLSPAINVRASGFGALRAKGESAVEAAAEILDDPNPYHRSRAVWLLARLGDRGRAVVRDRLSDPDARMRITAFRALRSVSTREEAVELAAQLAGDGSADVRREVALALRNVPFEQKNEILLSLARAYDGADRWYLEAFGIGSLGREEAVFDLLSDSLTRAAESASTDPVEWDDRFARLAWRLHPASAVDAFKRRAASTDLSIGERRRALVALGFVDGASAAQAMADLTHVEQRDIAQRASWWMEYRTLNDWRDHAVQGWARVAPAAPGEPLERLVDLKALVLDGAARIDRRIEAAQALARSPMGGRMLIDLAEQGRLAYQIRPAVGSIIFSNADASVRSLASRYFLPPGGDLEFDVDEIVGLNPDPQRGRALFSASCSSCHQIAGSGGRVGPDLTSIRDKFDRTALVDAVVHPDGAVALGYEPTIVRFGDGRILIGQVLSEGELVVLRDAAGRRLTGDASDIQERRRLDVGLMPEPQQLGLSPADVADIVAFLANPGVER